MRSPLATIVFVSMALYAHGQVLHYNVMKGSRNIGNLEVRKSAGKWSGHTIEISSNVKYKILITLEVDFHLVENFEEGTLKSGRATNKLNGVVQKESEIRWDGQSYELKFGGVPNTISEKVKYSISEIYFREPALGQRAFSQHFGLFLEFEKVDEHAYRVYSPDGENYYRYENGICVEVRIFRDFGNLIFEMQPESYALVKQRADTLSNK